MFTTAQDALAWFRERGYPTFSQAVFVEPPLSEGARRNIAEWAQLAEVLPETGIPLHIYWVRLTDSAEQSQDAYRYLYLAVKQFANRYPQYHTLFVVRRRRGVSLMCAYFKERQLRVVSAPLEPSNARLWETLRYSPEVPTEKHWQRILRAITGEEAMYPRVEQAFENFLVELNEILAEAQAMIKRKVDEGRFGEVATLSQQAEQIQRLIEKVRALWASQGELQRFPTLVAPYARSRQQPSKRASTSPITPRAAYIRPLLQALVDLGGGARVEKVLARVYELVRNQLKPKDLEKLPSGRDVRWRNTVMWARYELKQQGYLNPNSPKGIWEITDAGREYLRQLQAEESQFSESR